MPSLRPSGRRSWTKDDWDNWRERTWRAASRHADLEEIPRPYDLRHSFASLLIAEGRTIHDVAAQLGHSAKLTLDTYGHGLAELAGAERVNAEAEIARARKGMFPQSSLDEDGGDDSADASAG